MQNGPSPYLKKILTAFQGSAHYHLGRGLADAGSRKIVACVFSTGERTEEQSISSIRKQTVPVTRIEVIRNVSPISAASNHALDLARDADYLLWVDADMILYEHCAGDLLRLMRPDTLYSVGTLMDPVFGKVGYIKLLNMHIVRRLDLRFRDVLGCDADFCRQLEEKDRSVIPETYTILRTALGIHHPTYTARELFRKNQIEKKKRKNGTDAKLLVSLAGKYLRTRNPVLLAGLLGEILPNPDTAEGESFPESGLHLWETVNAWLKCPDGITYGFPDEKTGTGRHV